jgi:PAS domain S-box-containing protein
MAIEAAPTGMLLMNLKGAIVLVNAQIERLFGYSRDELLGNPIEMLVPHYSRMQQFGTPADSYGARSPQTPETVPHDVEGIRNDGTVMPIEIAFTSLHTSQGDLMLASIVDLSARREVDRLRTEFVSMVSHELRTPLTAISASLGLLHSGALGELAGQTAAMVRIAHRNSGRLERIINDILDIGTLEAGKMAMQIIDVPLAESIQHSLEASAGHAELCDVRYVLDCGSVTARVKADPNRLVQVITNLLSNAAKFSPAGANVLIRVLPGPRTVRIEVEDSGPGIPEAFQSRIFEKFAQAQPAAKRRFEGAGLGLSISRKLIEAMSGLIGFTTIVNQGTIFYLELPRADSDTMRI